MCLFKKRIVSIKKNDIKREWYVVDAAGSTLGRLSELTNKRVFRKDEYDFFKNAYEFLAELLIKNQIKSFKSNKKISNFIDPKKLTQREKTVLKIYLKKIKELKTRLKADFGEEYV